MSRTARVTFSYVAEQEDELSLEVGDIITNIVDVDVGWCEGELNGKKGVFPNNFVEEVVAPDSSSNSVAGKKAKVTFDYEAQDADELTLKLDDIVDILGEEEPGWWKGQLGDRIGVFPSNFVEIIDESKAEQVKDLPAETPKEATPRNEHVDGLIDEEENVMKRTSSIGAAAKKLPGGGMGFGNLINPNILAEKKLKKVHHDDKREKKSKPEEKSSVPRAEPSKPSTVKTKAPVSAKSRPAPPVPLTSPVKKANERAKVTFAYEPENADELKLVEGDIITILNKDITESEGWWEGELNGKVGMFPNNFVELLPPEEEAKVSVPPHPPPGIPVLPVKDETKKSPILPKKVAPSLPAKDESDSDAAPEPMPATSRSDKKPAHIATKDQAPLKDPVPPPQAAKNESDADHSSEIRRPTPGKKPAAPEKPSIPPKKPLPVKAKKPDITWKKPDRKVEPDKGTAVKKSVEDARERANGKEAESSHVKEAPKDEQQSKPTPEIKTESVEEAPVSFDDIPETETLNHLTANRAKHPQKRPPSKDGRVSNSPRLSGNFEEQLAETIKQPPGRPKEPPKEPAWKKEVREAREKKQAGDEKAPAPLLAPKSNAVEKRKSLHRDDAQAAQVPPVQKVEPFATASPGEVEKLRKEVSELREMMSKMEKKHNEMLKKLEEKFIREIEILTNDFDEEKKQNAANSSALKVELDRIKRRQSRFNLEETQ